MTMRRVMLTMTAAASSATATRMFMRMFSASGMAPTSTTTTFMAFMPMATSATATAVTGGIIGNPEHRTGAKFVQRRLHGQGFRQKHLDATLPERTKDLTIELRADDRIESGDLRFMCTQIDFVKRVIFQIEEMKVHRFCRIGLDRRRQALRTNYRNTDFHGFLNTGYRAAIMQPRPAGTLVPADISGTAFRISLGRP